MDTCPISSVSCMYEMPNDASNCIPMSSSIYLELRIPSFRSLNVLLGSACIVLKREIDGDPPFSQDLVGIILNRLSGQLRGFLGRFLILFIVVLEGILAALSFGVGFGMREFDQ